MAQPLTDPPAAVRVFRVVRSSRDPRSRRSAMMTSSPSPPAPCSMTCGAVGEIPVNAAAAPAPAGRHGYSGFLAAGVLLRGAGFAGGSGGGA